MLLKFANSSHVSKVQIETSGRCEMSLTNMLVRFSNNKHGSILLCGMK